MTVLFESEYLDGFGTLPLAYTPFGGPDFGEVQAVAHIVGSGDETAFHAAFVDAGDRMAAEADTALAAGLPQSAREALLKASAMYSVSYHPFYASPVDPRLTSSFAAQIDAFDRALALGPHPVLPMRIPFEATSMPAYLIPAVGHEGERRPVVIATNGFDSTVTDSYFASAVAISRRGYHCLIFDGPGQGELLFTQGVPLRPDWETVLTAVIDAIAPLDIVDESQIALTGWSLGGYLALRAASGEPRIVACIADPGFASMSDQGAGLLKAAGASPEEAADPTQLTDAVVEKAYAMISANPGTTWAILKRGFWVLGEPDLKSFFIRTLDYTLKGRIDRITCPTLVMAAENDPLSKLADDVFAQLPPATTTLQKFTAAEGAGEHVEEFNRSLANRRQLDWLQGVVPLPAD